MSTGGVGGCGRARDYGSEGMVWERRGKDGITCIPKDMQ